MHGMRIGNSLGPGIIKPFQNGQQKIKCECFLAKNKVLLVREKLAFGRYKVPLCQYCNIKEGLQWTTPSMGQQNQCDVEGNVSPE